MIKDQILRTSFDLFSQNGIKNVSMDDIAQTIGISKRTIYESYADKEELLCQGIIYNYDRNIKLMNVYEKEATTILEAIILFFNDIMKKPRCYNKKYFNDLKRFPKALDLQNKFRTEFFEKCKSCFEKGVKEGVFIPDINIEIWSLLAEKHANMLQPSTSFSNHSVVELFNTVFYTFLRGISTENGIQIVEYYTKQNRTK